MTATLLLAELHRRDVVVMENAGRLELDVPDGALDAALLAEVRAAKAELLALLAATPPALQAWPGLELCDDGPLLGLWHWRGFIMPTQATMPAYRRYYQQKNGEAG